jgi:hypothetical protein
MLDHGRQALNQDIAEGVSRAVVSPVLSARVKSGLRALDLLPSMGDAPCERSAWKT